MSTAHSQEIKPDSMAGGLTRLIIVAVFALLACFAYYALALPLKNSPNKHRNEVTISSNLQSYKA